MKKLLIVESPAKIKTISKFLDKDFKIMSTIGHIKDLPSKTTGVVLPPEGPIEIEYVTMENKDKVIKDICREAKTADAIFLAPDPDREGEIIAWHIGQEIERVAKNNAAISRITFNEITKKAITQAIEHPSTVDMKKVSAQQARRILDRWVGYEVSPVLWRKITSGLSAGRVQSVALRLVCERELAIRAFKPEEHWSITGAFDQHNIPLSADLAHINKKPFVIGSQKEVDEVLKHLENAAYTITDITDKERVKNPIAPFETSTLQQAAFNRLGFSVKKTMDVAQKLYEGIPLNDPSTPIALITYMRTDSLRISDSALEQARTFIKKTYGAEYLPAQPNEYTKKTDKSQDAHEAIRPIDIAVTPEQVRAHVGGDAAKLYALIWQRFVACQMKPALYAQRQVVINDSSNKYTFKVTGSTLTFDGFLKVYGEEEDEKEAVIRIPQDLKVKQAIELKKLSPKQHFTQAPPRYTEASLVKELKKEGIGRPSTYSAILNTIRARAYTTLDTKKRFIPTELGMTVTKMLTENLPKIMDIKFTAHLEEDLDKIAHGEMARDTLLRGFYGDFKTDVDKFRGSTGRAAEPTDIECPTCHAHKLLIRFAKGGEFLGCAGYPECTYTSKFTRSEDGTIVLAAPAEVHLVDEKCPDCGKQLRQVAGRYGMFLACSGYPECKYIHQPTADFPCPSCGGVIAQRSWRGGKFWGCKNYPKCKFAIFGDIEKTPCPRCHRPFMVKKTNRQGEVTLKCSDAQCGSPKAKKYDDFVDLSIINPDDDADASPKKASKGRKVASTKKTTTTTKRTKTTAKTTEKTATQSEKPKRTRKVSQQSE